MARMITICLALVFLTVAPAVVAAEWVTINYPDSKSTNILDIDGVYAVGQYSSTTDNHPHAFLYDTNTKLFTKIDPNQATSGAWPKSIIGDKVVGGFNIAQSSPPNVLAYYLYDIGKQEWTVLDDYVPTISSVTGILNSNAVGAYWDGGSIYAGVCHGFLYKPNSRTWENFDPPGSIGTYPVYSSGTQIVGSYYDASGSKHNFLYDGAAEKFTDIDMPGLASQLEVFPNAVDASNVIGNYKTHGFLYDGKDWYTLDYPDSLWTNVNDIDGGTITGQYIADDIFYTDHSFIYSIADGTYANIDVPGTMNTYVTAIDGADIVGYYHSSPDQGFIYTIPEPSTLVFLFLGCVLFRRKK